MKNNYNYGSLSPFVDIASIDWSISPERMPKDLPVEVEIGFGTGEYLAGLASASPQTFFVGLEQCPKRIIKTLRKLHAAGLSNVRLLRIDAALAFQCYFSPESLEKVHCLFPCPWPKDRHEKHRLLRKSFLTIVRSRLRTGGVFRIVTDHHPYADWIIEQLPGTGFSCARSLVGAIHGTKFEKKWQANGQERFSELILRADLPAPLIHQEERTVKTYFLDKCDLASMVLNKVEGPQNITFTERLLDLSQGSAMIHAIVSEDGCMQHIWIMVNKTTKGWCVSSAPGTAALPTEGVRRAVEAVFQALQATVV